MLVNKQLGYDLGSKEMVQGISGNQNPDGESHFSRMLSQAILEAIDIAIIATDTSGKILFLNSFAEKLTGWRSYEVITSALSDIFKVIDEVTFVSLEDSVKEVLHERQAPHFSDGAFLIKRDKSLAPIEYSLLPIYDSDKIIANALVFRETNYLLTANPQQSWQPDHDALTGLVNRSSFEDYLTQALQESEALARHHILCHLDLDRFKVINEVCGHVAGDEFLRQFSAVLQRRIRKTDILARLGGDEFGLILHHCSLNQALSVIQVLHEEVRKLRFSWQSHMFNFTFSVGVTLLHSNSGSASNALIEADSACSVAKGKGRDRVQVYQTDDQDVSAHRGKTQGVLRVIKALDEDQFLLYCQPIVPVDKTNDSVCQHRSEILIRLQDEQGKLILPSDFLPAAEQYGLMHLIDRRVVQNLFKTLNQRNMKNQKSSCESGAKESWSHHYFVNISGSTFNDDQFLDFLQEQFAIYSIPPEMISFEITETVAISNLNKAVKFITQLRELGCRFALDDFGSGMSSFGYLKNLPIDYIKIDGNFVKEIAYNPTAYEIVKSINSIGHTMQIQTTAEFVENQEILEILKNLGVDYAQGYGIAKPAPL